MTRRKLLPPWERNPGHPAGSYLWQRTFPVLIYQIESNMALQWHSSNDFVYWPVQIIFSSFSFECSLMTQFGVFLCAEQQKTYRRKVWGLEERGVGGCWRSVSSSAVNSAFNIPLFLLVWCWLLRTLHVSVGLTGNCAFVGIDKRARVAVLHYIENLIKF
jgi:hypothetical protein